MRVRPLGFRPPRFTVDAEVEWVLQRAFGPLKWTPTRHLFEQRLVDVALRLDLASRIAARHPRELVESEMGAKAAHRLREQYVGTVARAALLDHTLSELLAQARAANIRCILLKYAALNRLGVLRVGSRVASDLDVLVPQAQARRFQAWLMKEGYRDLGLPESSHQLAALQAPSGVLIELHLHVPLVTLAPGQPFARADDLLAAGLTKESGNALLPEVAVLAAHAIAHGLMQHACAPHMYSPLKTFADLEDLRPVRPHLVQEARTYLTQTMTNEDLESVQVLAEALPEGDLTRAMEGNAGLLLRHALASQLDHRYAICLRLASLTRRRASSLRNARQFLRSIRSAWDWARTAPSRPL